MNNLHEFSMRDIDGDERSLDEWSGKVVLVVNVASKCGLTPQYDGLQRLYDEYRGQGVEILAFPCNQFMEQEPGSESEIKDFCEIQFGVTFPLFSKTRVNGEGRAPLYAWLAGATVGPEEAGDIKWNFGKFLVGKDGNVRARFAPQTEPCAGEVKQAIDAALAEQS
jgi:glutathione peroxidase